MSAGADASGGRTAELLKVAASGRGVVTSSGAWTWSSGERGRRLSGWSAELCPTMLLLMVDGRGVRARTMLAEASVGGLVDGCRRWWERRAELSALSNGPVV